MNSEHQNGSAEDKSFFDYIEKLSDRELQEKQSYYLMNLEKSNRRILLNLQFWFYTFLISIVIGFFVLINISK